MEKRIIRIRLDFISGPLWKELYDPKKKELVTGVAVVDQDPYIQNLNSGIQELYSSYYHFDYNDHPVYFDHEQEKKDKEKMLDLLKKLKDRLDALNDGSFEVVDEETERVKAL